MSGGTAPVANPGTVASTSADVNVQALAKVPQVSLVFWLIISSKRPGAT
jgi:hypothetical protein